MKSFQELTNNELYEILVKRQEIFIVEQNCPFNDADYIDTNCWHLIGTVDSKFAAYARLVPPKDKFDGPSIGRIITPIQYRGKGVGKLLMNEAISQTQLFYPDKPIYLGGQIHLEKFYNQFGFKRIGNPYDEDGILHINMKR